MIAQKVIRLKSGQTVLYAHKLMPIVTYSYIYRC